MRRHGGADSAPGGRPPRRGAKRRHPAIGLLPWAAVGVAAAVGAVLAGVSLFVAGCLVALACAAIALGWRFGENGRAALEDEIERRTSELKRALSELEIAQAETVQRLSMAVEFRDEDTGAHIERIGRFSVLLAEHIGMDSEFCERLRHAAPLHDVGKVAIPDAILLKPGPLTPEERAIVETHAEEGHRLVRGSSSSILDMAATIALSHQEKWDGTGYPRGLKGEAIPIEGRIVAVADVFDALTSDRVYRKAFSVEEGVQMMREQRGRHFDPVLLDAFMEVLGRSGPDAREQLRSDPVALVESTLETFATALERGDAEMAEGAIATAIEDGVSPTTLHAEVIGPALRRISVLSEAGQIDADREHRATTITRRVLATLYRYMTGSTEPTRERVLLAGVEGDEHTLGLQMVHDQLAAAGFHTIFDTDLSADRLLEMVDSQSPDLVVVGATVSTAVESVELALRDLRCNRPDLPIVLGGPAVGGSLPRERQGMRVLERIDESVEAVEDLLATSRLGRIGIDFARMSTRAIVTGGAGFIGSHVVDALLADGYAVTVVDDLSSGDANRVAGDAKLLELDIVDYAALEAVVSDVRPRAIFHLAAQASVVASVQDPGRDCEVNVKGTLNVVQAAAGCEAPVVFTSTGGALYGDEAPMPTAEARIPAPLSPYGASKWAAEAYVRTWSLSSGIPHAVCRLGNVYGPRQSPHGEAGVVAIFAHHLYTEAAPKLYGHGKPTRDYVYVGDVVSALLSASGRSGTYNVATGVETDVASIWRELSSAAGKQIEPELADLRPGELTHSCLDIGLAERELGWRPEVPIAQGLRLTYEALVEEFERR